MRNIGRRSSGSTAESSWFRNRARHSVAAHGKTIGCPQSASGRRNMSLTFDRPAPWPEFVENLSWAIFSKCVLPRVVRLRLWNRRTRTTPKDRVNPNRKGGETEANHWNESSGFAARFGLKLCFHFRFSAWLLYCRRLNSFVGVFSVVSEFNLARIALELTMPTIFARTVPLKKKINMGMD